VSAYCLENKHMAIKRCKRGVFMFNRNDSHIGRSLDAYGEWCDYEVFTTEPFLRDGDIVIDVGANIGTHAVPFSEFVGRTGMVLAFEPQQLAFQMLCGNAVLNGCNNLKGFNVAVGEQPGRIGLQLSPDPSVAFNFGYLKTGKEFEGQCQTQVVKLDDCDVKNCRLIKIDVEGAEARVLAGALKLIGRFRPYLYIEYGEPDNHIADMLRELDYNVSWSLFPYFSPFNFFGQTRNVFTETVWSANLFCAPKEGQPQLAGHMPFCGRGDTWHACAVRIMNEHPECEFATMIRKHFPNDLEYEKPIGNAA
jgi:FkbM family methyltransferase